MSTSIIATVISAVTFISVPTSVFRDGGNLYYVQILLGLMLAKVLIGLVFAGPFYRATDCRTIYEYIGRQLTPKNR